MTRLHEGFCFLDHFVGFKAHRFISRGAGQHGHHALGAEALAIPGQPGLALSSPMGRSPSFMRRCDQDRRTVS